MVKIFAKTEEWKGGNDRWKNCENEICWMEDLCVWKRWCEFLKNSGHETVDSSWNLMAHGDTREGKWRGNWRMQWAASTLHTSSKHGVSNITTADAHTSAASSRLNWRYRQLKWTRPFRWKTNTGPCACAITFQLASTCIAVSLFMSAACTLCFGCDTTVSQMKTLNFKVFI